jgi:hypothetical protein
LQVRKQNFEPYRLQANDKIFPIFIRHFITAPALCPETSDHYHLLLFLRKEALIEWLEVTLLNVYEVIAPFDTPSTFTSAIW